MTSVHAEEINLPNIGSSAAGILQAEEESTGEAVIRNIRRAGGLIDDPLLINYLNSVGFKLISSRPETGTNFHFYLINDNTINAFALPGGYIGVNYGLFLTAESEDELASVIAHEIAHVTQRHHARYSDRGNTNIPVVAAIIAAMILGSQDSEIGEAVFASAAGITAQQQLNFSRGNEQEADNIGIALLSAAGFNPASMARFFEQLDKKSRLYGSQAPEFLQTHPVTVSRIAGAQNRAENLPKKSPVDQAAYLLMRTRILVMTHNAPEKLIAEFESQLTSTRSDIAQAARYGLVLIHLKTGNLARAQALLQPLLNSANIKLPFILAQADIYKELKQTKTAQNYFQRYLDLYPSNSALIYGYARFLLAEKKFYPARELLRKFYRDGEKAPELFQYLSMAEAGLGNQIAAYEALSEHYYLIGHTPQAITQLQIALKHKEKIDFLQMSRIEARLIELQDELALIKQAR